jgi:hypothetical protein
MYKCGWCGNVHSKLEIPPGTCEPKPDMVNQPPHYTSGNLEVIDILKDQLTPEEYEGFLKGNILKYTLRYRLKNGLQDLEKSEWYLKKLIELKKTP